MALTGGFIARRQGAEAPSERDTLAEDIPISQTFLSIDVNDLPCVRCPEAYEAYTLLHDGLFTRGEWKRFSNGEGCPACEWGAKTEQLLSEAEQQHRQEIFFEHWYAASQ